MQYVIVFFDISELSNKRPGSFFTILLILVIFRITERLSRRPFSNMSFNNSILFIDQLFNGITLSIILILYKQARIRETRFYVFQLLTVIIYAFSFDFYIFNSFTREKRWNQNLLNSSKTMFLDYSYQFIYLVNN